MSDNLYTTAILVGQRNSDRTCKPRVCNTSTLDNKGLQNLYSRVRFPPAPPISLTGFLPKKSTACSQPNSLLPVGDSTSRKVGQNGEPRAKRAKHVGQVGRYTNSDKLGSTGATMQSRGIPTRRIARLARVSRLIGRATSGHIAPLKGQKEAQSWRWV
jgi:hypothetical protein